MKDYIIATHGHSMREGNAFSRVCPIYMGKGGPAVPAPRCSGNHNIIGERLFPLQPTSQEGRPLLALQV